MKRLILSLIPVALIALVSIGSMGGCNSSGDVCDIRFSEFYNGSSQATQDSEWSCVNGGAVVFTIAFFGDGTGTRSDAGGFTWEQTKCRELDFDTDSPSNQGRSMTSRGPWRRQAGLRSGSSPSIRRPTASGTSRSYAIMSNSFNKEIT